MLCKHEVVGSIPSGSTILLGLGRALVRAGAIETVRWVPTRPDSQRESLPPAATLRALWLRVVVWRAKISDIVKRECDCRRGESLSSAVMFGKHTAVGSETTRSLVFLRP